MSAQTACQRISDLLSSYLDGDLVATARWDVKLHLESCTSCARFAAELAATVRALHRLRGLAQFARASSIAEVHRKPDRSPETSSGRGLPN